MSRPGISGSGSAAPVVDSNAILADPEGMLKSLCRALGIAWDPAMLAWEAGPHPTDGIWGSHWYNAVWNSTGFGQPTPFRDLSADARLVADACRADYEALTRYALSPLD
jgi:Sulfotransferase domain